MKRDRSKQHLVKADYEKFRHHDTRYYGLFYKKDENGICVKVDLKRLQTTTGYSFTDAQLKVINRRKTHYFYPQKGEYSDYCCNIFSTRIQNIQEYWNNHYRDLIQYASSRIEKPAEKMTGDCGLFMSGILEFDEAQMWATLENVKNEERYRWECDLAVRSLYAQFIHQMASQIEAVTVTVLTRKNAIEKQFCRNILYATAAGKAQKVTGLPSFRYYDKLYCIWNFIKHNSQSTYEKLNGTFPEVICRGNEYHQGESAYCFINFSDELIQELLDGCDAFFKEYCELVFDENYEEAQWNYGKYFFDIVDDTREMIINPMGLPWCL